MKVMTTVTPSTVTDNGFFFLVFPRNRRLPRVLSGRWVECVKLLLFPLRPKDPGRHSALAGC